MGVKAQKIFIGDIAARKSEDSQSGGRARDKVGPGPTSDLGRGDARGRGHFRVREGADVEPQFERVCHVGLFAPSGRFRQAIFPYASKRACCLVSACVYIERATPTPGGEGT